MKGGDMISVMRVKTCHGIKVVWYDGINMKRDACEHSNLTKIPIHVFVSIVSRKGKRSVFFYKPVAFLALPEVQLCFPIKGDNLYGWWVVFRKI